MKPYLRRPSSRRVIALGLLAGACTDAPPEVAPVERTDSAGIEIVHSRTGAWTEESRWRLSDGPLGTIGEMEGDTPYLLQRVVGATRLPDGRIVIGDGGSNELRFFDESGTFLHAVGRTGEGPGEFGYLRALRRCAGDSLFAFDLSWQLSVFDLEGEFSRSLRLVFPGTNQTPYSLSCDREGRLLLGSWGAEALQRIVGLYRTTAELKLTDTDNRLLHDFGEFAGAERLGTVNGSSRPHPLGKTLTHALGPDGVYVGTADEHQVRVFDAEGRLRRIIRWEGESLEITPEDKEAYRQVRIAGVSEEARPAVERELRDMPYPATRPAYSSLELDPEGNLWVQGFRMADQGRHTWTVFSPSGEMLGEVEMPEGLRVHEIGPDYVLGVDRDELGVGRVRRYGLVRARLTAALYRR